MMFRLAFHLESTEQILGEACLHQLLKHRVHVHEEGASLCVADEIEERRAVEDHPAASRSTGR